MDNDQRFYSIDLLSRSSLPSHLLKRPSKRSKRLETSLEFFSKALTKFDRNPRQQSVFFHGSGSVEATSTFRMVSNEDLGS